MKKHNAFEVSPSKLPVAINNPCHGIMELLLLVTMNKGKHCCWSEQHSQCFSSGEMPARYSVNAAQKLNPIWNQEQIWQLTLISNLLLLGFLVYLK